MLEGLGRETLKLADCVNYYKIMVMLSILLASLHYLLQGFLGEPANNYFSRLSLCSAKCLFLEG